MSENDDLGDFEEFGDTPDSDEDPDDTDEEYSGETHVVDADADRDSRGVVVQGEGDLPETEEQAERLQNLASEVASLRGDLERSRPLDEENPLSLDPRVGVKDLAFDRAKPGAKVYVVDLLAESVDEYYEEFPDAPALDEYGGNVLVRFRDADAVFACVYVKDSLTSVDSNLTAYPMPESRLTRYPAEEATMVGSAEVEFARTDVPGGEE